MDSSAYTEGWQVSNETDLSQQITCWVHQTEAQTGATSFLALSETWYEGSGYVVEFTHNPTESLEILQQLQTHMWTDEYTRALFVELNTYQPSRELFTVAIIMFEVFPTGNVIPYHNMMNAKLFFYHTKDLQLNSFMVEIVFLILMVGFSYREFKRFMSVTWKEYVTNAWTWLELLIMSLSYAVVALFAVRVITVKMVLDEYTSNGVGKFTSFYPAAVSDYLLTYTLAALVLVLTIKLVQLLQFSRRILILTSTLSSTSPAMTALICLIMISFVLFTGMGLLLMQPYCSNMARFQYVFVALVSLLLMEMPYDEEECTGADITQHIAPAYFFVIGMIMVLFYLPFIEALLDYGIKHIHKTHKQKLKDRYELMDYMWMKLMQIFGSAPTTDLERIDNNINQN